MDFIIVRIEQELKKNKMSSITPLSLIILFVFVSAQIGSPVAQTVIPSMVKEIERKKEMFVFLSECQEY